MEELGELLPILCFFIALGFGIISLWQWYRLYRTLHKRQVVFDKTLLSKQETE